MKFRKQFFAIVLFALAVCLFSSAVPVSASPWSLFGPANAQDPSTPPPALAIANNLEAQARSAENYSALLKNAGNSEGANQQLDIAHRRYFQAAQKLGEIDTSATYGRTRWAPEALVAKSTIEDQKLNNYNAVVLTLKALFDKHGGEDFPGKAQAQGLQKSAEQTVDHVNSTKMPGSILYKTIDFFVALTGRTQYSYAIAILLISVIVKLALTPLSNMQYKSMREMQRLTPVLAEIKAKYKNPQDQQARTMEVYKEHGVNPMAGCVPVLIQMPIMFLLYYGIRLYAYQFTHGTFLWISPALGHLYPGTFAPNLGMADTPILLLYGVSMFVQQKMTVPTDPSQAEQQKMMAIMMPLMSTFMFFQWKLPSAFVLYYLTFNLLSMAQQKYYMKVRANDGPVQPIKLTGSSTVDESSSKSSYKSNGAAATKRTSSANRSSAKGTTSTSRPTAKGTIAPPDSTTSKKKPRQPGNGHNSN